MNWFFDPYQKARDAANSPASLTPSRSETKMPLDAKYVSTLYSAFRDEFDHELSLAQLMNAGPATEEQIEGICEKLVGRHAGELYKLQQVQDGNFVDTSQISPNYVQELEKRGATQEAITDFAQRIWPHLEKREAVARWVEKAKKMPGGDIRYGADANSGSFYDPNNRSRPRESND